MQGKDEQICQLSNKHQNLLEEKMDQLEANNALNMVKSTLGAQIEEMRNKILSLEKEKVEMSLNQALVVAETQAYNTSMPQVKGTGWDAEDDLLSLDDLE